MERLKGKLAPNYKRIVSNSQIHKWLDTNYGKPRICESKTCDGKTENRWFDWAKKTGMEYERNRKNFFRLCRSCHRKYDMTEEKKQQAMDNLWWRTGNKIDHEKGEDCHRSKLKEADILEIRRLYKTIPTRELAEKYDIKPHYLYRIIKRITWKHI